MSNPASVYQYLRSQGVSHTHALGMLANIQGESAFNPSAVGDNGNAYGLFQHNGPRKRSLMSHAGSASPSWQQQIDFALSEPDTAAYLQQDFSDPASATAWFTRHWERPADKDGAVRKRVSALPGLMASLDGDGPPISPYDLPDKTMQGYGSLPPEAYLQGGSLPQVPSSGERMNLPPLLQNLMENPGGRSNPDRGGMLGMMGAGILSKMNNPILQGIGEGYMGYQGQQDKARQQDLWAAQNQLALLKQWGYDMPSPSEIGRARDTVLFRGPDGDQLELMFDKIRGTYLYQGQPVSPDWLRQNGYQQINNPDLYSPVVQRTAGAARADTTPYEVTLPGGGVTYSRGFPEDLPEGARVSKIGTGGGGGQGEGGGSEIAGYEAALANLRTQVLAPMQANPEARRALGTLGTIGSQASGVAGIADAVLGTNLGEKVKDFYGGLDPAIINGVIAQSTLPVARLLVDPKGPLAGAEQQQAQTLLTKYRENGMLAPEQAYQLLLLTEKALAAQLKAKGSRSGPMTTPPETAASPPATAAPIQTPFGTLTPIEVP